MRRRTLLANLVAASVFGPRYVLAQPATGRQYRIAIATEGVTADIAESGVAKNGMADSWGAFLQQLRKNGYVENENIVIERYGAEGHVDQYAAIAQAMVRSKPDVLVALATIGLQLLRATDKFPIVAALLDPLGMGLVQSLARPGKNFTGVTVDAGPAVFGKGVEVLRELLPSLSRMGILAPPSRVADSVVAAVSAAAQHFGIEPVQARPELPLTASTYRRAFAAMLDANVGAVLVTGAPENAANDRTIVDLASEFRLPAIYPIRSFVEVGGLIAYGFDPPELFRHMADQVAAILKGAEPGDIPIYQPTKFQLFLNLKTAKALGIAVPTSLLVRADDVIE
jgi:putative tryptophan/tyrosine transport system substrate-binding protein